MLFPKANKALFSIEKARDSKKKACHIPHADLGKEDKINVAFKMQQRLVKGLAVTSAPNQR